MHKAAPAIVVLAAMAAVILALFAFRRPTEQPRPNSQPEQASSQPTRLIITSPHNEGIQREFKRAFEAWYLRTWGAPCTVEWQDHGGTSDIMRFIKSEFAASPGGIGIDIMWGGGIEPHMQLAELGLLQPIEMPTEALKGLPEAVGGVPLRDPNRYWYGTALSGFGIIYNRKRLADLRLPEPRTWADLAAPEFLGEVGAADPRKSGTAHAMLEVILQAYGWEKGFEVLTRLSANVKNFPAGAGDIPKLVSMGDIAAGLAIDFYAWTQIRLDGKEKIGFVLPEGLTPITPDGICILKGAPNPVQASRFVQFVLSPDGQALWLLPKGHPGGPVEFELLRVPVLPEAYAKYASVTNVLLDPAKVKVGFHYDAVKASARRDALKDLYGAIFIDLAPELTAAWKTVIKRGMKPEEIKALCAPPIDEMALIELSRRDWTKPDLRNMKLTEWSRLARERYQTLIKRP